jgi:hypothetical protein
MTDTETPDTATTHDTATCTDLAIFRLQLDRKPESARDADDSPVAVELLMHIHSLVEAEQVLDSLREAQARLQAMILLHRLQNAVPSDLLSEMLDQLGDIVERDLPGDDDER